MKKTLKKRLVLFLFVLLLIVFSIISSLLYIAISEKVKTDEYMLCDAAADFAAVEIDSQKAKDYFTTRKTDQEYQNVTRKFLEYTHGSKINRISMITYGSTVGYYIYDTDNKTLGTKVSYDDYTTSVKLNLIECRETWNVTRNGKNYTYRPVRNIDDTSVGYIIIESDAQNDRLWIVFLGIGAAAVLLLLGVSWISVFRLRKTIFRPIETFASAAAEFTGSDSEDDEGEELKKKFETGRNDEIGHLGQSLISMINVINNSRKNFSSAVFDATHDGMTKTYNKRHYESKVASFQSCSSICVIYFDVNNLKLINDTLGHERGDYVIKRAAEYIKEVSYDENSMCFRMGGDEFLLVMTDHSYKDIYALINRLDNDCPVILSAETDSIKCSIAYGYAYDKTNYSYEKLLAEAEENMYRKKYEIKQQLNMPER